MAEWRNAAYNCYSSCHKVCPVTLGHRDEGHTPTAFHANVVAMDRGHFAIEEVALVAQRPPEARRVTDQVMMPFDRVYEFDPGLMSEHTRQQQFPAWETLRIGDSRWDHPAWMHHHFADGLVSGEELLEEINVEEAEKE